MEDVGHSGLLKFLVSGDTKMSETSTIKSEVPGEQNLRGGGSSVDNENPTLNPDDNAQSSLQEAGSSEIAAADDFTLAPVITITKQESTFTKGEMKLQKVTVSEDISVRFQHLFKKQTTPGKTVVTSIQRLDYKY